MCVQMYGLQCKNQSQQVQIKMNIILKFIILKIKTRPIQEAHPCLFVSQHSYYLVLLQWFLPLNLNREHNCQHFCFKGQTHFILKNIYFNQNLIHQTGLIKLSSIKNLRSLSEYNKEKTVFLVFISNQEDSKHTQLSWKVTIVSTTTRKATHK